MAELDSICHEDDEIDDVIQVYMDRLRSGFVKEVKPIVEEKEIILFDNGIHKLDSDSDSSIMDSEYADEYQMEDESPADDDQLFKIGENLHEDDIMKEMDNMEQLLDLEFIKMHDEWVNVKPEQNDGFLSELSVDDDEQFEVGIVDRLMSYGKLTLNYIREQFV